MGEIPVALDGRTDEGDWQEFSGNVAVPDGVGPLYLEYRGLGAVDLLSFTLE